MVLNRTLKSYNTIYDEIYKLYIDDDMTINKCCDKVHISPNQYYRICKTLGKNSVASCNNTYSQKGGGVNNKVTVNPNTTSDTKNHKEKNKNIKEQNKNIVNNIIHDNNNKTFENQFRFFEEKTKSWRQ